MKKYTQLSIEERYLIYSLKHEGFSKREIAEKLNRHPSTISRELQRNKSRVRYSHAKYPRYEYLPDTAQIIKTERRKQANARTPLKNETLKEYIITKLKQHWSPDIIAGTLKNTYKNNCKYTISHETIYKFIYTKHGEELGLKNYLTRRHKTRRKYTGRKTQKLPKIPNRRDITERNIIYTKLQSRKEFGHFEGDSILSKRQTYSAIHTEVERKTRFILARKIQRKTAEYTTIATISIFQQLQDKTDKNIIKSTTWDNGTEFSNHEEVTKQTNIQIFFADPYKSWQRGTNEHANGMIRRFFPKGTNFDEITEEEIQQVINYLNNRPRKILGYRTAKECFDEEITKLSKQY